MTGKSTNNPGEYSIREKYAPASFDFGQVVARQIDRILELGSESVSDSSKKEDCLEAINFLEDILAGWWDDEDKAGKAYKATLKEIREKVEEKNIKDKKKIAHVKLRALSELCRRVGLQGEIRGYGYTFPIGTGVDEEAGSG